MYGLDVPPRALAPMTHRFKAISNYQTQPAADELQMPGAFVYVAAGGMDMGCTINSGAVW